MSSERTLTNSKETGDYKNKRDTWNKVDRQDMKGKFNEDVENLRKKS
jgi:hypothetical protein